jgi:superfamily I DNA/RNA helicase
MLARTHKLAGRFECLLKETGHLFSTAKGVSANLEELDAMHAFERARGGAELRGEEANEVLKAPGRKPRYDTEDRVGFADLKLKDDKWYNVLRNIPVGRRSYYRAARRQGSNLRQAPRIHVSTIHGVKGGEADNVAILSDMGPRVYEGFRKHADDEHRVWYVGVTRSKGDLHIVSPRSRKHYPI